MQGLVNRTWIVTWALVSVLSGTALAQGHVIWAIGDRDNRAGEFALAPGEYARFLEKDFGWEDRYFLIGRSQAAKDWPYIMPSCSRRHSGGFRASSGRWMSGYAAANSLFPSSGRLP
jgi:hypothetical protein